MDAPRRRAHPWTMLLRTGYTLLEIAIVLTIAAIILLLAVPTLARGRDALAVRSARSDLANAVALARSTAIVAGGAQVIINAPAATVTVQTASGAVTRDTLFLRTMYGVTVESDGAVPTVLRFDALGIGRLANATVRVRRGGQMAALTVSSYGRVKL